MVASNPFSLNQVLQATQLSYAEADFLFASLFRPAGDEMELGATVTAPEAAGLWFYQLLQDIFDSSRHPRDILELLWPALQRCACYLSDHGDPYLPVQITDRRFVKIEGFPWFDLKTSEHGSPPIHGLETITFNVAELYRRTALRLRPTHAELRPCPSSA